MSQGGWHQRSDTKSCQDRGHRVVSHSLHQTVSMAGKFENFQDTECRLVVVGRTGSGKSSVVNTLLGVDRCEVSMFAESTTSEVTLYPIQRYGKFLRVVDTPGLFDSRPAMTNKEVMKRLAQVALLLTPGPHAFLLTLQIGHRLTDEEKAVLKHLKDVFGDLYLKHTIIVFTRGDELKAKKVTIDAYIEKAPADLKTLLQEACQRYVVFDNIDKGGCAKVLLDLVDKMARHGASRFYSTALFKDAEKVLARSEREEVGKLTGERQVSDLNRNEVATMIKSIRASRVSLKDEEPEPEPSARDLNALTSFLMRLIRIVIRSDVSEGKQTGAIERMMASPSMVGMLPLLPPERRNEEIKNA